MYLDLSDASRHGNINSVITFLKRGDNPNHLDSFGNSPLAYGAEKNNVAMMTILIKYGANPELPNLEDNATPLIVASAEGNVSAVNYLFSLNVGINALDKYSRNGFMYAVIYGHCAVVDLFLKKTELEINVQDENGFTAIMWAVIQNQNEIFKKILTREDLNLEIKDETGATVLFCAVEENRLEMVRELTKAGANITIQNNFGTNILMAAINVANIQLLEEILQNQNLNQILNAKDNNGDTALMVGIKSAKKLNDYILTLQGQKDEQSKLFAATTNLEAIVCMLSKLSRVKGIDLSITNNNGDNVCTLAQASGIKELKDIIHDAISIQTSLILGDNKGGRTVSPPLKLQNALRTCATAHTNCHQKV